jgi:2-amino-4-hydroxy-6-hydroxymethyldihydropteridine diphosphokinase
MARCLISFGANLGDPRATIVQAQEKLRVETQATSFRVSRLYITPPVGGPVGQPPFLNRVVALETPLSPWDVWRAVRAVEADLGRERFRRWEARRIDVDILLYEHDRIWTPQLKIPHPRLCMRRFILEPAAEVAAEWRDPVSGQTIAALASRLRGSRANLVLCAERADRPIWLLEQVARQAAANWEVLEPSQVDMFSSADRPSAAAECSRADLAMRWVAAIECQSLKSHQPVVSIEPPPKLVVFFVADDVADRGGQWEDAQRQLALRLNLLPLATDMSADDTSCLPALYNQGARYLLATADADWAVHELVAALDAMDCPVEPTP